VRRTVWAGAVLGALLLLLTGFATWVYTASHQSNTGGLAFTEPLAVPPLLEPDEDEEGRKHFDLTLQEGVSELLPGVQTETWGVNGSYLGPTLRAEDGDEVVITVDNELGEATTLHWHGMRLPAEMDGGPHQEIPAGGDWEPSWTVDQPAASLWYHPHMHGATAEHVYRGLAGMFLIDDEESQSLDLPQEYGVDDIPLIVQDKQFHDDGSLDASAGGPTGVPGLDIFGLLGEEILVNGTHAPYLDVEAERVRLRVLNGSNSRSYHLGFDDDRDFDLIATDTGMLDAPERLDRVRLSPGERAEIVAEFTPGEEVVLRSDAPGLGGGSERFAGLDDEFDLLQIRAAEELTPAAAVPDALATTLAIEAPQDATVREFSLGGDDRINGQTMDMARINEVVPAGATEIWEVFNPSIPHSFHIHEASFQIIDIDGEAPPAYARGRKDTVYVEPGTRVRLAVRFGEHTDPETPYMYHCHMLEHEDKGMMGQFVIVEPGTEDEVEPYPPELADHEAHAHH
jgi:suppressor of ftsI